MARLSRLPATIQRLPPPRAALDTSETERSRFRDATQHWRRWYKTARWRKLRWSILVRDAFTCRFCGKVEADTSQIVCDHVEPHRGNEAAFWAGPFQTLCKPCHDGEKQAADKAPAGRIDRSGGAGCYRRRQSP